MINKKSIVTWILISLFTCGIGGIIWFIQITDDMRNASGETRLSGVTAFLLTLITCGIYGWYWAYLMGKAQTMAKQRRGLPAEDNSVLYLVLQIFQLGIVVYCLAQNELNMMADMDMGMHGPQVPPMGPPMGPPPMQGM